MRRWRVVFPRGSAGLLLRSALSSPLSQSVPLQFNWYTRRAVLTGIYNTTELVMMQDTSPDFEDTWRFLENRVADAMNMSSAAQQVQSTGKALAQGLMGAAVTITNLTGLNQRR